MDLYKTVSYSLSEKLTLSYSSSFGRSSKLFSKSIRRHIYALYGLVRIADEIVDTYQGAKTRILLDRLEDETLEAISIGYSINPIIHSFAATVNEFEIPTEFIKAFFSSMRMDITMRSFTQQQYEKYIYGSAEVIGLMCLRVFTNKDETLFAQLSDGAKCLGSAYQKVNFLRDIKSDFEDRNRVYFPGISYEEFNEQDKAKIIADIRQDFQASLEAMSKLPNNCRLAVETSSQYYVTLLEKLEGSPVEQIKSERIRVGDRYKIGLFCKAYIKSWSYR